MGSSAGGSRRSYPETTDLTDNLGREHATRTRSIAWVVCDHVSVLVEGRTGGYLLDRIRPDTTQEPRP